MDGTNDVVVDQYVRVTKTFNSLRPVTNNDRITADLKMRKYSANFDDPLLTP